jgi:copper chaperone CopZ
MKYRIKINGMHCQGCSNLIKMTLEDEGLKEVHVDIATGTGSFETPVKDQTQVTAELNEAFAGLSGYTYENLTEDLK